MGQQRSRKLRIQAITSVICSGARIRLASLDAKSSEKPAAPSPSSPWGNGAASAFLETIPDFDHARSASSTAVSSKSAQNANRIRLSGRRLANATPAEIAAIPPSASGNPTTQST